MASTKKLKTSNTTATAPAPSSSLPTSSTSTSSSSFGGNLYPPGCEEVHEDMPVDELIRRLKVLASALQNMEQEENAYDEYVPLCLHLVGEGFLNYGSRDVRILIACCIADILRIYAPVAPYKEDDQVKRIFKFLISQLEGLKRPMDSAFNRCLYLLENLAYVKSFNMCFELDNAQDIFCSLFDLIFSILHDEHSAKVKSLMLDILCPLVSEAETVSNQLLNIILSNIVEPMKSSKKKAYKFAKELILKCSDALEPFIKNFFRQVLILGKGDESLLITHKVYDLIYELYRICPTVSMAIIPHLENKLKNPEDADRLGCVSLLAQLFSQTESSLALDNLPLWQAFLRRFNDISVAIRIKCVQHSMHFLLNHPELRNDIVEALRLRQHDDNEVIRLEVVKAIVKTAKSNFSIVAENEDLLSCVRERALDKKVKIRTEALQGLGLIYEKHLDLGMEEVPEPLERAAKWIKDAILQNYYMTLDDQILVERLLRTSLVPYQLEAKDRMMKLLYLYSTIDTSATKAFIEIQQNLVIVRNLVAELLNVIRNHWIEQDYPEQLNLRISNLTKFLPDPVKAAEFIARFCNDLEEDEELMRAMEVIVSPVTDCKTCAKSVNQVLRKLGAPVMTNLYYNTMKLLLERISSFLIDKEAISKLVPLMHEVSNGTSLFGLCSGTVVERGCNLISVLASVFASHFHDEKVLECLMNLLNNDNLPGESISSILLALQYIGQVKPIGQINSKLMEILVHHCQNLLMTGTPRQGKIAVRCLHVNTQESVRKQIFAEVVKVLRANLDPANSSYGTAIVALGHIALLMPQEFKDEMKAIVPQKIVKELLLKPKRTLDDYLKNYGDWCEKEELPEITKCMIHGMKTVVRCLMGLKTDLKSAANAFEMLTAFVKTGGDFIQQEVEVEFSDAEKAWLRLAAGKCMLKLSTQKGVGDQFMAQQFCSLARLMNDKVEQVRSRFVGKLHKGLSQGIPYKCLPLDFLGFYALVGYESNKQLRDQSKEYMMEDVNKRREFIESVIVNFKDDEEAEEHLPRIMPEYMLAFAVPVLTFNPRFTSHEDIEQLTKIKECLWFLLELLILKDESHSFGFYKMLIERMKNHRNALEPENEEANCRMYAICDIAFGLLIQHSPNFGFKNSSEPRIPSMYFKRHEDPYWVNLRVYLPPEMRYSALKVRVPNERRRIAKKDPVEIIVDENGNASNDAQPTDAMLTQFEIPGTQKS